MVRKLLKVVLVFGLILAAFFASSCNAGKLSNKPKSTAELLQRMKTKYKKIKRLSYRRTYTYGGVVAPSQIWEDPPLSIEVSKIDTELYSDKIWYSLSYTSAGGHKVLDTLNVSLVEDNVSDVRILVSPLSLIEVAEEEGLDYQGIKVKGSSFFYVLKGESGARIEEALIDPETLLPVRVSRTVEEEVREAEDFSGYKINPTINKSRFRVELPTKAKKLAGSFTNLQGSPDLSIEDGTADDFPCDLYFPSQVPAVCKLIEIEAKRAKSDGWLDGKKYPYEFSSVVLKFEGKKSAETDYNPSVEFSMEIVNDEKGFKRHLLAMAGTDARGKTTINSSMPEVIAALNRRLEEVGEEPREASLKSGKVYYWLSEGKIREAVIKKDNNWLYITQGVFSGDKAGEQLFLAFADSLTK